jgi:hypothetical protein
MTSSFRQCAIGCAIGLMVGSVMHPAAMSSPAAAQDATQPPPDPAASPKPPPTNKYVVRGCLKGSTLTDIAPTPPRLKLPEKLRVATVRTLRDQVKGLDGHQVELTGALVGVEGVEEGILIGDAAAKVYIGGGDPNIGQDLVVKRNDPPTIRVTMIKDVAPVCAQNK